jgi:hypothetical protein
MFVYAGLNLLNPFVAQQHSDPARRHHGKVRDAIAVEVSYRWGANHCVSSGNLEASIAIIQ